jgi:hypothetical protein
MAQGQVEDGLALGRWAGLARLVWAKLKELIFLNIELVFRIDSRIGI